MKYFYRESFLRTRKRLEQSRQRTTDSAIEALIDYFATGQKTTGLGLKQLRTPYWEIRVGLDTRILFVLEGDLLTFVIVGNHDEIRRYLRHA